MIIGLSNFNWYIFLNLIFVSCNCWIFLIILRILALKLAWRYIIWMVIYLKLAIVNYLLAITFFRLRKIIYIVIINIKLRNLLNLFWFGIFCFIFLQLHTFYLLFILVPKNFSQLIKAWSFSERFDSLLRIRHKISSILHRFLIRWSW